MRTGDSEIGSKVSGAIVGALFFVGATILIAVLILKWRAKKRVKNLQMDIHALYVMCQFMSEYWPIYTPI